MRASGKSKEVNEDKNTVKDPGELPNPDYISKSYFDEIGRVDTKVYLLESLSPNHVIPGPALLIDNISTIVVEPNCTAHITDLKDVRIDV